MDWVGLNWTLDWTGCCGYRSRQRCWLPRRSCCRCYSYNPVQLWTKELESGRDWAFSQANTHTIVPVVVVPSRSPISQIGLPSKPSIISRLSGSLAHWLGRDHGITSEPVSRSAQLQLQLQLRGDWPKLAESSFGAPVCKCLMTLFTA